MCLPYQYFRSTIYEKRVKLYEKCDLLTDEILGLERQSDGHIDHPEGGTQGSKDQSDAVCGAIYHASQYVEEYTHIYGETLSALVDANSFDGKVESRKQETVDFEEELKRAYSDWGNFRATTVPKNNDIDPLCVII